MSYSISPNRSRRSAAIAAGVESAARHVRRIGHHSAVGDSDCDTDLQDTDSRVETSPESTPCDL